MTFAELESCLPNGFHDSKIESLEIDYVERRLKMRIFVWVGSMDDPLETREAKRLGELTAEGLVFCVIDPPSQKYPFENGPLDVDAGDGHPSKSAVSLPEIPAGAFLFWFFVNEWNSFIRVAARNLALEWK